MGTRSVTLVKTFDLESPTLLCMYRQFDGYPSGHGEDLKAKFGNTKIINGISSEQKAPEFANGMGCFAAQLIADFKEEIGGIYVHSIDGDNSFIDYVYTLYVKEYPSTKQPTPLYIAINDGEKDIYNGLFADCDMSALE